MQSTGDNLKRYHARQAREEYRESVGWPAAMLGLWGLLAVAWAALDPEHPYAPVLLLGGVPSGLVAYGLLRRRPWSRWPGAVLLLAAGITEVVFLVQGFEFNDLLHAFKPALLLSGATYLALPGALRHFETAPPDDVTP